MVKHTDNYYNKKIRELVKPCLDNIEKAHPGCTIYPYIVSWTRSNPYESGVDFDLNGHNYSGKHYSGEFIHTTSYEKLYEIIKAMKYGELSRKIYSVFKTKCLKIQ